MSHYNFFYDSTNECLVRSVEHYFQNKISFSFIQLDSDSKAMQTKETLNVLLYNNNPICNNFFEKNSVNLSSIYITENGFILPSIFLENCRPGQSILFSSLNKLHIHEESLGGIPCKYLPLPVDINPNDKILHKKCLIPFIGPLESRLYESIEIVSDIYSESDLIILNLNPNANILNQCLRYEGLRVEEIIDINSVRSFNDLFHELDLLFYPNYSSVFEPHFIILFAFKAKVPLILQALSLDEVYPPSLVFDNFRHLSKDTFREYRNKASLSREDNFKSISETNSVDLFINDFIALSSPQSRL